MESKKHPDYIGRIKRLRESVKKGWLLLHRGGEYFNENLFYLTGIESFYTAVLISLESDDVFVFINSLEYESVSSLCEDWNVLSCEPDVLPVKLTQAISKHKISDLFADYAFSSRTPLPTEMIDLIRTNHPRICIHPLPGSLLKMRMIKDDYEIATIRRGLNVIENIFSALPDLIEPGKRESDISAEIHRQLIQGGFNKFYDIFVASGKHSAYPFYRANNDFIPTNSVVLIDICAAIDHYVCDVTRTFPTSGEFTQRDKSIYSVVSDVYKNAVQSAVPGNTLDSISQKAKEQFTASDLNQYYLNKIGHFVGLSPDDPGAGDILLERGMVITIEPGLYMTNEGLGIRMENTIIL
jgi:Xaa-Pro aminopeptidase